MYKINFCASKKLLGNSLDEHTETAVVSWIRRHLSEAKLHESCQSNNMLETWLDQFSNTRLAEDQLFNNFQVNKCVIFINLQVHHGHVVTSLHQNLLQIFENAGTSPQLMERSFLRAIETRLVQFSFAQLTVFQNNTTTGQVVASGHQRQHFWAFFF